MTLPDMPASNSDDPLVGVSTRNGDSASPEEIARLAYDFYNMRGCQDGHDVEDWLRAEQELGELYCDYREYA